MAFPETLLPLQVDLSLDGSTWTDVTSDVRYESKIRITRGRSDWGQQVDYGRCQFALSNTDGTYSPRNPEGTYYGQIGRNTPVRVSVNTGTVALDLPGDPTDYASTPDTAALDITGDIDVRFDATLANWCLADYPSEGRSEFDRTELIGKRDTGQISWHLTVRTSKLRLTWSEDGSALKAATSTADLPLTTDGRLAVRVTLDVNNGAAGHTATFYTSDSISGTWTQLGDTVVGSGTTSIYSGTAGLYIGSIPDAAYFEAIGRVHAAQVRNGIAGTVVANPDFTAQSDGTTSFADSAGRTWTVAGNAEITNRKTRFVGEVASWTPRWTTGGFDVITEVEAAGVLRRLGQGAVPLKSPMYRELTSPGRTSIVAYWPMEDGANATMLGSAIAGHPAFAITGSVTPAAYPDWVGSDAIPEVGTGSMKVNVPAYTLDTDNPASMLFVFVRVPAAGVVSTQRLVSTSMTGTASMWSLYVNTSGQLDFRAYDADGTQVHASGFGSDSINGLEKLVIIRWTAPTALNTSYVVSVYDIADSMDTAVPDNTSTSFTFNATVIGYTMGRITQIRFGEDGAMNGTAIGHVAIGNSTLSSSGIAAPMVGWNAEEAPSRVTRLGDEEDIHAYPTGPGDEQMGVQARNNAVELMRAAEAVDKGILAEQRALLGIRYVTRSSMYSQPVTFTMDYTGTDGLVTPLDPVDDDQQVTNDVTEQRDGGASARAVLTTGALSTQAPPDGIGLYDTSYTTNLLDDTQPAHHVAWRLHLGTWDETRFPQVTVNLAAAPASIEDAAAVDVGSRLQITNPAVWLPPDTLDLLCQGYTETLDQKTWTITYNCTPYGPFNVAWAGDDTTVTAEREFSWADTDGSELAEALTTTETDVDVLTTTYPTWTDEASDTPFDWRAGGEVMTVTAPGGLINTNPFFTTDTTGWTGQNATISRVTTANRVNPHPRAAASLLIAPDGVNASGGATCAITAVDSITPGASYVASMWVYSAGGWSDLRPAIDWYTSASAFISSGLGSGTSVAAGVWTYVEQTLTAPATASRAIMRARHGGTPSVADTWHVWAVRLTRIKASASYDEFGRTAASSWGLADSGATWTNTGGTAANYAVGSGYGSHTLATVDVSRRTTITAASADCDVYCDVATDQLATGGSLYGGLIARHADVDNLYTARIQFLTTQAIVLSLRKRVAGVETELDTFTTSLTHVAGTAVRLRFQVFGSDLKARVWATTVPEPVEWQVEATDTALTAAQSWGCRSITFTGNTNVNPAVRYDNFDVINPQTYTVTRSVNGVVKTHSAGTDVRLAFPAYAAL